MSPDLLIILPLGLKGRVGSVKIPDLLEEPDEIVVRESDGGSSGPGALKEEKKLLKRRYCIKNRLFDR